MLELYNYPPSLLGSGGTCPSHNLVCAFEKKDGSANDMQSDTRFENMDPRFDVTIVRDGSILGARGAIDISDPNSQDANRQSQSSFYRYRLLFTQIP